MTVVQDLFITHMTVVQDLVFVTHMAVVQDLLFIMLMAVVQDLVFRLQNFLLNTHMAVA